MFFHYLKTTIFRSIIKVKNIMFRAETKVILPYKKFAGPTAHWRVGSPEYNPRSFNPSGGGPRARNARPAGQSQRYFRPLGAPGLDFYRFWAVLFPTSILGWIFDGFWIHFGIEFRIFSMISASLFRGCFWTDFSMNNHHFSNF